MPRENTTQDTAFFNILTLATLILISLPVGIACIVLGFGLGDNPCILCWQERMGMILIAAIALFIIRYGLKPKFLGLLILQACFGIFMSLRHSAAHLLRDIGQGFSVKILGAHTYTWGILIYWSVMVFLGLILLFSNYRFPEKPFLKINRFQKTTFYTFLVVISFNIIQAFTQTGPPPYIGHGDPARMSFKPSDWDWSVNKWLNMSKAFSFRGAFAPEKPNFSIRKKLNSSELPFIEAISSLEIPEQIKGNIRDIDFNENKRLWVVATDEDKLYVYNEDFTKLLSYLKVDPLYSVDIQEYVGVSFINDKQILVTSVNKSFLLFELNKDSIGQDQIAEIYPESFGATELKRSRLSTVRAKLKYISSHGTSANEFYTIAQSTNSKDDGFVISYFSLDDYQLNSENYLG